MKKLKVHIHLTKKQDSYIASFGEPYQTRIEGKSKEGVIKRAMAACEKMGLEGVIPNS